MSKVVKRKKGDIIYYEDELNDDFDELGLERPKIPEGYQYIKKSKVWNFLSNFVYYCIAWPVLGTYCSIKGIKVKNKKNIKALLKDGGFIYANHTAFSDAFLPQVYVVGGKRRTYIIGYSDSLTIPFVNRLTELLGYIPLPTADDLKSYGKFLKCLEYHIKKKHLILIYPEAHIWPYYTKIRPFKSSSFHYPAKFNVPIISLTTIYTKGRFKNSKPKRTIVVGDPIYPRADLNVKDNKEYLRNECYKQMVDASNSVEQEEYYHYVKKEK